MVTRTTFGTAAGKSNRHSWWTSLMVSFAQSEGLFQSPAAL